MSVPAEAGASAPLSPTVMEQDDAEIDEGFEDEAASEVLDTIEADPLSQTVAESAPATPVDSMIPPAPITASEPITTSALVPTSAPLSSSEVLPEVDPNAVGQTQVTPEEKVPPHDPDRQDGQVNE